MNKGPFKIALLCGGPSQERGISLNSARSVLDHLVSDEIKVIPIYFDYKKQPYQISPAQLYSNTPSDFDFKLAQASVALSGTALKRLLKSVDIAFPAIHGPFGEDGELQEMLEKIGCPFVGSSSKACRAAFDKYSSGEIMREKGLFTLPTLLIERSTKNPRAKIKSFFKEQKLKRAIVKPTTGGSSIGTFSVEDPTEAFEKVTHLLKNRLYRRVIVEPFCNGREFTVIVLQNRFRLPVALPPVEIATDYKNGEIFDYRKKYLATGSVTYHCPPRFKDAVVEKIQIQAEQVFSLLGLSDFARLDGWLLDDGQIWFSDINTVSGMEQNSFLFLSPAQLGMNHRDVLKYIIRNACLLRGIEPPISSEGVGAQKPKKRINVIFGGDSAERQVSLMSGTNVWLKLKRSKKLDPHPYLLDTDGKVWELPYPMTLNHTVEEVSEVCKRASKNIKRLEKYRREAIEKLALDAGETSEQIFIPKKMSLERFVSGSDTVFNTVHGGDGENGVFQKKFENARVYYNGPDSKASRVCMDKFATGKAINRMGQRGILTAKKKLIALSKLKKLNDEGYINLWSNLLKEFGGDSVIVKPPQDGCSAGVVKLSSWNDLKLYVKFTLNREKFIPRRTLDNQSEIVELPVQTPHELLFEQFIETDRVRIVNNKIIWKEITGWVEVTVGVVGKKGRMRALNPSITVATGNVLSLEEKFQGGTGVNITPPPEQYVSKQIVAVVKKRIEQVAKALGLSGYSRIDAFLNCKSGEVIIIEVNTLPGLTPSTVIFHQALAENPPQYPREFLEKIVSYSRP